MFGLKPELVMELMYAAEYMQIPSLVVHVINMLAEYADGTFLLIGMDQANSVSDVPSFVGLSDTLMKQVCNKCKPSTLRKIEIDGKLDDQSFETGNNSLGCPLALIII